MAIYICEADHPYSSFDLELTEHRDGTYDAELGIVQYDENGDATMTAVITDKNITEESCLPKGEMSAIHRGIRELGRNKTKNIILSFLEDGGATQLREEYNTMRRKSPHYWEDTRKFYVWANDLMHHILFGDAHSR